MGLSVERLRWVLIAGAVLLVGVLVGAVQYGRYVARTKWKKFLENTHVTYSHDSNGVTYSQSDGKRTIYTLHAKKAIPEGNGMYRLQHADLTLFGKVPGEDEHISGEDFEWNEKEGVARAQGEVKLELHTPPSREKREKVAAGAKASENGSQTIHVTTSGLRYMRSLGVAATSEKVEFSWGGLTCDSQGAEFDPDESTLHLLADVHLTGTMQGHPLTMTATEAHLDRTTNLADLSRAVAHSDGKSAQADRVLLYFRPDGTIERAQGTGSVAMTSGTQSVTATRMDVTLNAQSKPVTMRLSGGVAMADSNALRPVHGSAEAVDATFDAKGLPKLAIATGAVSMAMTDKSGTGPELGGHDLNREMHGDRVVGTFVAAKGRGKGESLAKTKTGPVVKTVNASGDALKALFGVGAGGRPEMQHVSGAGHTVLEQEIPLGEMETSTGDTLEMVFGAAGAKGSGMEAGKVLSAVQTGNVDIHTRAAVASGKPAGTKPEEIAAGGDRAVYNGVDETLTLTGSARFSNGVDSLTAATVVMDQRNGDAVAKGKVVAAVGGEGAAGSAASSAEQPVTHVLSAEAKFIRAGKLAEFRGTDQAPAKMWQGASQLQAAVLFFDGVKRLMSARPLAVGQVVHAVFAEQGKGTAAATGTHGVAAKVVRVASQRMDYSDGQRQATFSGSVKMEGEVGTVESDRAVVMLSAAKSTKVATTVSPLGGSIEKAVAYGNVRVEETGRRGTGDQLTY
ncbi:MAG: hypothetical protein V4555_05405, partial [Acidobacteriota bacterium]